MVESTHQPTETNTHEQPQQEHSATNINEFVSTNSGSPILPKNNTNLSGQQILQLQRTIGNYATIRFINNGIQRHPSHAQEEEVQKKSLPSFAIQRHLENLGVEGQQPPHLSIQRHPGHDTEEVQRSSHSSIQRHPSHAQEEEVQRTPLPSLAIQRHPGHGEEQIQTKRQDNNVIQRIPKWVKNLGHGERIKEGKMSATYGMKIGNGGVGKAQFSMGMLNKLDKVLSQLPPEHLSGTFMTDMRMETGDGNASAYTDDTEEADNINTSPKKEGHIGFNMPQLPLPKSPRMPSWLFLMLSKKSNWQRNMMDEGAMSGGYDGTIPEEAEAKKLGIDKEKREVMSGISDVMSQGNMAEWIIRHEMGHAVDHKIKFTQTRAKLPQFGGWQTYDYNADVDRFAIALHLLSTAGITTSEANLMFERVKGKPPTARSPVEQFEKNLGGGDGSMLAWRVAAATQIDDFDNKWAKAFKHLKISQTQPWTFPDGGAQYLKWGGRVLHKDHYGTWVSYDFAARQNHALSNYQFSSPGEWFAEAYAAYYDPAGAADDRLTEPTKAWFTKNLGTLQNQKKPKGKEAPVEKGPGLIEGVGQLKELADLGPQLLHELKDNTASMDDVPEDLKNDKTMVDGF